MGSIAAIHRQAPSLAPGPGRARMVVPAGASPSEVPQDVVTLSPAARAQAEDTVAAATPPEEMRGEAAADGDELSLDEQKQVDELKARDQEVRAHEQAHAAVGGAHAGSPTYVYEQGPDGHRYAAGGEVKIDVSEVPGNPEQTIAKMQQVKAAALAPAEPSSQDRKVAAQAEQKAAQARTELAQEQGSSNGAPSDDDEDDPPTSSAARSTQRAYSMPASYATAAAHGSFAAMG